MDIAIIGNTQNKIQPAFPVRSNTNSETVQLPKTTTSSNQTGNSEQPQKETIQDIKEILKFLNTNSSIKFNYDESINRVIIQVLNGNNHEIIKQIPPENIVKFLKAFNELIGIIINKEI